MMVRIRPILSQVGVITIAVILFGEKIFLHHTVLYLREGANEIVDRYTFTGLRQSGRTCPGMPLKPNK